MSISQTATLNKATIAPLPWAEEGVLVPFMLVNSFSIEDVSESLKPDHFALWQDYLSRREREELASLRIALVHRFFSLEHMGKDEQESSELIHRVFVALRVVKPTRTRYSTIQCKTLENGRVDVFSITHPPNTPINAPDAESLNRISAQDLLVLKSILPTFLRVAENGPAHIQRAIRYYETAYAQIQDPVIQFLTWSMGIEAVASGPDSPKGRSSLLGRIYDLLDGGAWIYDSSPMNDFGDLPRLAVRDILPDIFKLRSRLVHGGGWPDWKSDAIRTTLTGERLGYAAVLREAAAFVLRKLILASLNAAAAGRDL